MNNKSLSDIWRHSWLSIWQSFFPEWIYNTIQMHSGKTSRPRFFAAPVLRGCATSLKLASRSLGRIYERSTFSDSRLKTQEIERYKHWRWIHRHFVTRKVNWHQAFKVLLDLQEKDCTSFTWNPHALSFVNYCVVIFRWKWISLSWFSFVPLKKGYWSQQKRLRSYPIWMQLYCQTVVLPLGDTSWRRWQLYNWNYYAPPRKMEEPVTRRAKAIDQRQDHWKKQWRTCQGKRNAWKISSFVKRLSLIYINPRRSEQNSFFLLCAVVKFWWYFRFIIDIQ